MITNTGSWVSYKHLKINYYLAQANFMGWRILPRLWETNCERWRKRLRKIYRAKYNTVEYTLFECFECWTISGQIRRATHNASVDGKLAIYIKNILQMIKNISKKKKRKWEELQEVTSVRQGWTEIRSSVTKQFFPYQKDCFITSE